jgi:hypothetical protein
MVISWCEYLKCPPADRLGSRHFSTGMRITVKFVATYWIGKVHQLLTSNGWQAMYTNPVAWSWTKNGREPADLVITDFGKGHWKFLLRISNQAWEFRATAKTFVGTDHFWTTLDKEAWGDTDYIDKIRELTRESDPFPQI